MRLPATVPAATGETTPRLTRRGFLAALGAGMTSVLATTPGTAAPQGSQPGADQPGAQQGPRLTMSGPMSESAYRPVQRPAKPGAQASMTAADRDALEHQIHCQCGCTLDVYTCRTTDFTCPVSPAMHADVMQLVAGGYTGPEIIAAFRAAYGERVLMAPTREGFNWAAYVTPFVALGAGAGLVAVLIQRWKRAADLAAQPIASATAGGHAAHAHVDATPEELARLDAAVRDDR